MVPTIVLNSTSASVYGLQPQLCNVSWYPYVFGLAAKGIARSQIDDSTCLHLNRLKLKNHLLHFVMEGPVSILVEN